MLLKDNHKEDKESTAGAEGNREDNKPLHNTHMEEVVLQMDHIHKEEGMDPTVPLGLVVAVSFGPSVAKAKLQTNDNDG